MRKRLTFLIVGGFFYICLVLLWGRQYQIMIVQAKEIAEDIEDGYLPPNEETEQDSGEVLSDNIGKIEEVNDTDRDNNSEDFTEDENSNVLQEDRQDNEETDEEPMTDNQFRILVIFCFGLSVGVIVGHFLTGFIK